MPELEKGTFFVKISSIDTSTRPREDMGDLLALTRSIKDNGMMNPVVIDGTNKLIAGRRRIEAAKLLKKEEIEARRYEELSDFQIELLSLEEEVIHKKKLSWPEEVSMKRRLHDLYVAEYKHIKRGVRQNKAWSQKSTATTLGIANSTLSDDIRLAEALKLFPELAHIKSKRDAIRKMYRLREFSILTELAKRRATRGEDQFDDVKFVNGDCLKLLPKMSADSVDLIITDPPWGIELGGMQGARAREYEMFDDSKQGLYTKVIPELFRVLKDGSHLYLFFGVEHYTEIYKLLTKAGFDVREVPCIWVKEGPSFSNWEYKPMPQYEMFFFAVKATDKTAPKRLKETTSDIFDYSRTKGGKKIHPTEKPIELLKRLITLSSTENDIVFDPFAGSGSTLVAASLTKRLSIGFEINPEYYAAAMTRLREYIVLKTVEDS